jgi:hypothetical protein
MERPELGDRRTDGRFTAWWTHEELPESSDSSEQRRHPRNLNSDYVFANSKGEPYRNVRRSLQQEAIQRLSYDDGHQVDTTALA